MTHQKLFDHMIQEKLKSGLYNLSFVAGKLWPGMKSKSATAKLHSKLHNYQGKHFTEKELSDLEIILK